MTDLSTTYLGLKLKNPIIAGASSMSSDIHQLKKLEEAGASAIVYKTLFEEQIHLESAQMDDAMGSFNEMNAEMISLHPKLQHAGAEVHLVNFRKAKENLSIPLIASLNCLEDETWVEYARLLEKAGADALELNFFYVPKDFETDGRGIEEHQVELMRLVKNKVTIPVSVKLSSFYSNPLHTISRFDKAGAAGVVIFNKLFEPEINTEEIKHIAPFNLSHEGDYRLSLRYSGLLYKQISASICANSGIYNGNDVVKMLLAGADCVQVVSTLYKHKAEYIATMLEDLTNWMSAKGFGKISEFKGKLSKSEVKDPFIYKRAQYIDLLLSSEQLLK
ncbi:MAG: dihydroorotate dehydrogenase-like protein [Bacteroidales bacterium]|nr:dihydroorotate dehydrogenase-like protein [Bacteroidales bacterium]MBK7174080.1 dihydroorotate dehydrogenase-like protein [Bacteroidales bacterium]